MKLKKVLTAALAVATCFALSGCTNNQAKGTRFVTSCYPVYIIALNLTQGIDGVEVCNMSESQTGCLHDYQLQPEDMKNIEKSSAFIINGAGMENFLNKLVYDFPKVKIIDSSIDISLLTSTHCHDEHCHDEHCHDEHCHDEPNAHIWTSPENYIAQIKNITRGLQIIDEKNKEKYSENAERYIAKIQELQQEIKLESVHFKNKNIITLHDSFPYFAKEFGLNIVGVIGSDSHGEVTTKELAETINHAKEHKVNAIFTEPQYPSESTKTVADEINAKIYTLDSGATGEKEPDAYLKAMRANLATLKQALK